MFVMLSVRTTSVSERHNNKATTTTTTTTATTTTTSKTTNTQFTQTIQNQSSAITSSLTTTFDHLLTNKISIEHFFTKSVSFDKNINQSNLSLLQPNNLKEPPTQQTSVATILNDLSPAPSKIPNQKSFISTSHMTHKGFQENSPDVKAMRYYRLWIYTCNAVLLMAVIIFCCIAGKVLLADYRRLLIHGLNLGQPSFVYAYLALLIQSGFLQLVGCLGALRLSEKLLNAYWLLLLVLLIGDAILGIFWMFKFDRIMHELQPMLRYRFATEYGTSVDFSELWDRLQSEGRCCGVFGPQDYTANRSLPSSCCYVLPPDISDQISISKRPMASAVVFRDDSTANALASQAKANLTELTDITWNHLVNDNKDEIKKAVCRAIYQQGCFDKLVAWLRNTADILFVLGYCVIAFLKLSFLGILRYEIKEMIQKIKLLQQEMASEAMSGDGESMHHQQTSCVLLQIPSTTVNGGMHAERKVGNRERNRIGSGESEHESLLFHENTPKYTRNNQLNLCSEQDEGEISVGATATHSGRPLHGNSYELSEFDARGPTYRKSKWPSL
ncbi:uncharacterized protein LOC116349882 isoform X2 [Contarinia nasturtii]|uniref:uncharacterized protein LOC116349882 isoform X2 n=1 Tax=Contarinia nasturtii TaxID=265458 RepID=UPI0012D3BE51|nr:uncharacterized protein LOC116349882 isoform X2 [Contarinia nasturtii]